jgi:large subunit ribosomal protein L21
MKYAIIKIKGHQYKVSEGEEILVDRLGSDKAEPEVLLIVDGDKVQIGKPTLKEAKIKIKTLKEEKGEKIRVLKYKAKSRYRKVRGFRPQYTRLLIEKISL